MSDRPVLEGVRIDRDLNMLARWRAERHGAATFTRLEESPSDRRNEKRRSARLRWGKALDGADRFLCECLVNNRTRGGACLRLARNVTLPRKFQLYEDDSGELYEAQVVWRRGAQIGCRLSLTPKPDKADVARRMRSRYYAM